MGGTGKQLKILLLDVNCKYSSTGKIVYDLFTNLRENGQRAALCYGRGPLEQSSYPSEMTVLPCPQATGMGRRLSPPDQKTFFFSFGTYA